MNKLRLVINALWENDNSTASFLLKQVIVEKAEAKLLEDHELYMTSDQMEKHIIKLHGKAQDKDAFLKKLASYSDLDACTEKDFKKCADNIQSKGKIFMDKAIHALEKLIGYTFEPKKVDENLGNVITRPIPGVPDGGALIPNAYTTKTIPKKKKKLPSLKKNVYGTGMAPAGWRGEDYSGEGSSGGEGGGDGGGGE